MKVSFCITSYNQAGLIKRNLESVFALELPCDFEVLIGDDGSTDGTAEELEKFRKRYPDKIKIYFMPREAGKAYNIRKRVGANRLNIIEKASGDYIVSADGDDFFCRKTFVSEALEILEKDKSLVGCAFNFKISYSDGREETVSQNIKSGVLDTDWFVCKRKYIHVGGIVFRNILDSGKVSFLKQYGYFEDVITTFYMLQFGKLYYINEPAYVYYKWEGGVWNGSTVCNQTVVNAWLYGLAKCIIPKLSLQILKRHFNEIKYVYKNRNNLENLLGSERLKNHIRNAMDVQDCFLAGLLDWRRSGLNDKIKIVCAYYRLKLKRVLIFRRLNNNNEKNPLGRVV